LRSVAECVIDDGPTFHAEFKLWVVTFSIRRSAGALFIGEVTRWCALIETSYPLGAIAIQPATKGGITATFPHQLRNTPAIVSRIWRNGKLCLDSPLGDQRHLLSVRDPIGDVDARLRWHVERARLWLQRAADGQLLAAGDPFELPAKPTMTVRRWERYRLIHDETASCFGVWHGRDGSFGTVLLGRVPDIGNTIGVARFTDRNTEAIREWTGRELAQAADVIGFWWLWPQPIVLQPWETPGTWRELRRVAKAQGLDADAFLRWILPSLRGATPSSFLLLGYPIATRVGNAATEVHWDTLVLPPVPAAAGKPPRGFRPNTRGWWHRDRYETFADKLALQYLPTENWTPTRLQARGRLPDGIRNLRIALLGLGALGSSLAEMLVRAGVSELALVDGDLLQAGNVCRHTATLADVGKTKVEVVARRLRQMSPSVRVTEVARALGGPTHEIVELLDECDIIIDCTSSDEVLMLLAAAWWAIPRLFASFSTGFGAKRLFSFGVSGNRFTHDEFAVCFRLACLNTRTT
jgi:hypothetical protein